LAAGSARSRNDGQLSVSAVSDGPLSKDFDGLPASASRAL
jgi:hypothetical protein